MLYEAIMKCDPDIRGEMFSNIIVHGATAQLKGLEERIKEDLLKMLPMRMMWLVDIISITIVKEEDELGIDAPTHVLKGARMLAAEFSPYLEHPPENEHPLKKIRNLN
ncbi:hypothetical protein JKP88DRAFT_234819 [Tribonema minus]|uniref:Uncharacterized protein n=2 Tax=Tribonema minus TaxID=303371 RepID=A0A836CLL2_9STRA|nr:hypothetical protein JKP88DRAFT_234819 [Tribonema minus]